MSTTTEASIVFENSTNGQTSNASGENATNEKTTETIQKQPEEQDDEDEIIYVTDNKFTLQTTDEDEIIEKIQEKTKLDKDKIKRAIKFKHKEPVKDVEEDIEEEIIKSYPTTQFTRIQEINGSVIIRLG